MDKIQKTIQRLKDPFYFIETVLGVKYLTPDQKSIIKSVWENRETGVKSSPSMGKTFVAGCVALAFLCPNKGSKVITTATTAKQVEDLLWREIAQLYLNAKYPIGGKLNKTTLEIQADWFATGISPQVGKEEESATRMRGYHAKRLLVIVDEASGVSNPVMEAVEDITNNETARVLMISNPVTRSCGFYKFCKSEDTHAITMNAFTHPNIKEDKEIVGGAISRLWIRKQIKKHCEVATEHDKQTNTFEFEGKIYRPNQIATWRLMAEFPGLTTDTLITYEAIESAMSREPNKGADRPHIALDVARFGDDMSVFCINDNLNFTFRTLYHFDVAKLTGEAIKTIKELNPSKFAVDCDGIGAGVYDNLREYLDEHPDIECELIEIHSAASPDDMGQQEQFLNKRAQMYWLTRTDINMMSLEKNDELLDGLSSIKYFFNSKGKIQIEEKKDFKQRIGRSSDYEDALVYCNYLRYDTTELKMFFVKPNGA